MPLNDILETITGQPGASTTSPAPDPTRRCETTPRKPAENVSRLLSTTANSSRPISDPRRPSAIISSKPTNGKRPLVADSTNIISKNGPPTPPLSAGPPKPLKKGSFAEIMARAKAQQTMNKQVGKIQHKTIEKGPSKKEREAEQEKRRRNVKDAMDPKSKFQRTGHAQVSVGKSGKQSGKANTTEPEKKIKKAATATTGYTGTARPKTGSANGTNSSSRSSASSSRFDRARDPRRGLASSRYDRYLSEDEEDEEVDYEEDYASDASSDMEAAVFEVDEEEELASKIARKEDAEALAEENRLKREKEEKRRKLAAMAKKVKPRY